MSDYEKIAATRKAYKAAKPPDPPPHISKKMKEFWRGVFVTKNLQPYQILILKEACESHDRAEQARRILKKEGLTFVDRFEQPRARPEIQIELKYKALCTKLLLNLGIGTMPGTPATTTKSPGVSI